MLGPLGGSRKDYKEAFFLRSSVPQSLWGRESVYVYLCAYIEPYASGEKSREGRKKEGLSFSLSWRLLPTLSSVLAFYFLPSVLR